MGQSGDITKICGSFCTLSDSESCKYCDVNDILCDNSTKCIPRENVCDGTIQCDDETDESVCMQKDQTQQRQKDSSRAKDHECLSRPDEKILATSCDGVIECLYFDDECRVIKESNRTSNRDRRGEPTQFFCGEKTLDICKKIWNPKSEWYNCPGRPEKYLNRQNICDGEEDCDRQEGELLSIDEQDCDDRFTCANSRPIEKNRITIHKSRLCDFRIDCEGEEDEAEEICRGTGQQRFYCENRIGEDGKKMGELFVSIQAVLDGKRDCWDGSDECPTQFFEDNTFSSRHRMIRNVILSGLVWIMGVLALLGNSVVMWHSFVKLKFARRFSPMMRSNYILVFNLAAADFLMGIYLVALAIQNTITDGSYCNVDFAWRSGTACATLGSLALVSIQASVFFLVLLTTYRVVTVLRPFNANSHRVRFTVSFVACAWLLSVILAITPTLSQFKEYFVSSVWISPGVYFFDSNTPSKEKIGKFAKTLSSYMNYTQPGDSFSWDRIRHSIDQYYPEDWFELKILGEFGYYSAHSVCLPKFFVKAYDSAWAYSVAIMTFDLASFIYIATSYRLIYYDAARNGALRNGYDSIDENRTLQARITRLVLADFFCLVPVCITAFLSIVGVEINPVAYAVAAIVLLPINSAINPIIYSNVLNVIHSSCLDPITSWATKRIRKQKNRSKRDLDARARPRGPNGFPYRLRRGSTVTSNDENMNSERLRLGSDGSTSITNHFNISMETTNTKV